MKVLFKLPIFFLLLLTIDVCGQSTNISGVINSYLRVTAISSTQFTADNLLGSISDFAAGKKIMVYQAKGATINTTNTASYGAITSYNNAGNFELTSVSMITGSGPYTITVTNLVNAYTAAAVVQLVSVPQYMNAVVTGTVTAISWDAAQGRGGIVAMEISDKLTLSANVDASSKGFAGGAVSANSTDCPNSNYVSNSTVYGMKGEGIAAFVSGNQYARGPQANGGGGGNSHNAGGGGGSNSSAGGDGGKGFRYSTGLGGVSCTNAPGGYNANAPYDGGGLAGNTLSASNKIFFGGGGGSGQQNGSKATAGALGGGIILVRAGTVTSSCGSTYGFIANGGTAANTTGSGDDGAGGGGAGGTLVLDVLNYELSCTINGRANGGNGGSIGNSGTYGGGAGGGIGTIFQVQTSTNANTSFISTAGSNGQDCSTCPTPSGTASAAPTSAQQTSTLSAIPGTLTALPVELVSFRGKAEGHRSKLVWETASELNNDFFTVERSDEGFTFKKLITVPGAGTSKELHVYHYTDEIALTKVSYYRLLQTDFDGKQIQAAVIAVHPSDDNSSDIAIYAYPNPVDDHLMIANPMSITPDFMLLIWNVHGQLMHQSVKHETTSEVDVSSFSNGIYWIEIRKGGTKRFTKISVVHH